VKERNHLSQKGKKIERGKKINEGKKGPGDAPNFTGRKRRGDIGGRVFNVGGQGGKKPPFPIQWG